MMWRQQRFILCQLLIGCGILWSWWYLNWGGSGSGKSFYKHVAGMIFANVKNGTPIITLSLPLILSCTLGWVLYQKPSPNQSSMFRNAEVGMIVLFIVLIVLPILSYIICVLVRKVSELYSQHHQSRELHEEGSFENIKWMKIANVFGIAATTIVGWIMIVPIVKDSLIIQIWNPSSNWYPHLYKFHIWSGYLCIGLGFLHGTIHLLRQILYSDKPMYLCYNCPDDKSYDTCLMNWTGSFGLLGFLTIWGSSFIRRQYYQVFYVLHILSAPFIFVVLTLHWHRWILYTSPGLLYYLAAQWKTRTTSVKIMKHTKIGPHHVSLLLPLSSRDYHIGQYIKLHVPQLCKYTSHPFTINIHPPTGNMEILFKATGSFTKALREYNTGDTVQVQGYYGSESRGYERHSKYVIFAGGIGITPYLSLLNTATTVELHWVCRDVELMQYVQRNYFNNNNNNNTSITIHTTNDRDDTNDLPQSQVEVPDTFQPEDDEKVLLYSTSTKLSSWWFFVSWNIIAWSGLLGIWYFTSIKKYPILGITLAIGVSLLVSYIMSHHYFTNRLSFSSYTALYSSTNSQQERGNNSIQYCHYSGKRPILSNLLRQSMSSNNDDDIGIYICGPKSFTKDIKDHLKTTKSVSHVIYEELFEY